MADFDLQDTIVQPLSPPEPRLEQERLAREQAEAESAKGVGLGNVEGQDSLADVFKASWEADSLTQDAIGFAELDISVNQIDPDFDLAKLDDENTEMLFGGLPEHMYDVYEEATSMQHALAIRDNLVEPRLEAEKVLQRQGFWTQLGVRGTVSLLDPVTLAAVVASEGAMAPVIFSSKVGRIANGLRGGAWAAGSNAAIETALWANDPMRTSNDIMFAAATGFVIGAPLSGVFAPKKMRDSYTDLATEAKARGDGAEPSHVPQLDEDGLDHINAPTDRSVNDDIPALDETIQSTGRSKAELDERIPDATKAADEAKVTLAALNKELGKARSALTRAKKKEPEADHTELEDAVKKLEEGQASLVASKDKADATKKDLDTARAKFDQKDVSRSSTERYDQSEAAVDGRAAVANNVRLSMVSTLHSSTHAIINHIARKLTPDGVGVDTKGLGQGRTAQEDAHTFMHTNLSRYATESNVAFKEWVKETGGGFMRRWGFKARDEFEQAVTKAVRTGGSSNVHINKAANALREVNKNWAELLRDSGVKGFEDLDPNMNYVPRLFDFDKFSRIESEVGTGHLIDLVAKAIKNKQNDVGEFGEKINIDDETAAKIAKAYINTLRRVEAGESTINHVQLSTVQFDTLKEMLDESGDSISDETFEAIFRSVKKGAGEGVNPRAKQRLLLDEDAAIDIDGYGTLNFQDLLMGNAFDITNLYSRQMAGQVALARAGIKSRGDWARILQDIDNTKARSGLSNDEIARQKEMLNVIYRSIIGAPLHKVTRSSKVQQLMRDYNYTRVMNQTGWAQIAELGNTIGEHGLMTFARSIPAFGRIVRDGRTGKFDDTLMAEIDHIWAFGNDPLIHRAASRMSEPAEATNMMSGTLGGVSQVLKAAGKVTSTLSGMAPITTSLERMTAIMIIKNFADMATGASKYGAKRLAAMGINDEATKQAILTQLRTHAGTTEGPVSGRTINAINMDKWTDIPAREAFMTAVQRTTNRSIQRNNTGDMALWMTTDTGRTMMQFRSFIFGAYEKQLIRGMSQRDAATAMSWGLSTVFAGLAYVGQTHVKSIGREDRDEYLKKAMTWERIAKSSFVRSGYASLFPAAWDAAMFPFDPPSEWKFGYARASGQASSLIEGVPLFGLGTAALQTTKALTQTAMGNQNFTQKDFRTAGSLIGLQNLHPVQMLINYGASQFPENRQSLY